VNTDQEFLLDKNLSRIDFYINSINTKAAFIITFNTFVVGSIVLNFDKISRQLIPIYTSVMLFLSLTIIISAGVSIAYVLQAVYPYLDPGGNKERGYTSLLFFKSISEQSLETFEQNVRTLDGETLLNDLIKQNHILSIGASSKFQSISISILWLIYGVLVPVGIAVSIILINHSFYRA
jgi:hypothetical protein